METRIEVMLDQLAALRKEAFTKQDEELYRLFGSAMGKLMDARTKLRQAVNSGK